MIRPGVWILAAAPLLAQGPPDFDWSKLAAKAKETVEVNLDQNLLRVGGAFLSAREPDQAAAKELVRDLKGVFVRVFEFDKPNEYTTQDVESIRSQFVKSGWQKVVGVREGGGRESTSVYMQTAGDVIKGIFVLVAEPRELTVVSIDGSIRPEQLQDLGGKFGIPKMPGLVPPHKPNPAPKPEKKDEDE